MKVVVFEDELVAQLYPVTLSRPAFSITCGGYCLLDLLTALQRPLTYSARPYLREWIDEEFGRHFSPHGDVPGPSLLVNAALVPRAALVDRLLALADAGEPFVARHGERIAAAVLPRGQSLPADVLERGEVASFLAALELPRRELDLVLLEYPHEIIKHHLDTLSENLAHRIASGQYEQLSDGVFVADGARIGDYVVADTSRGPIVIEEGATIGPYCYLSGPVHVGRAARVNEHAAIKDGVVLGHTTKIGGEVEASIIEPYTNKQHHGFMGHSYLGSWINLGAGTCNSDLKNTYGTVNMEYRGRKVPTGMQFVGCIIGDYAKTAINTGIFTGKTIGVCSMVYGFVTTNVPGFVNYARSFGQVTETPVDVMVATQARMFARRNVAQRPCDIRLLHDMYELTRHERQLADEPLSF